MTMDTGSNVNINLRLIDFVNQNILRDTAEGRNGICN